MNEALTFAFEAARGGLLDVGLVFLRIGAILSLAPGLGERTIPMRVRLGLAIALAVTVAPAVAPGLAGRQLDSLAAFVPFLQAEILNGLVLGFVLRLFVLAIEMAGTIAAQSSSLSQMFAGAGEPMPAISSLLVMAALALLFATGAHVKLVGALILSYEALPPGAFPAAGLIRAWQVGHISAAFSLAFGLAAPFLIGALIYNMALGVINRAMPTLMVSLIGAPALTGGLMVLLAVVVPVALTVWLGGFSQLMDDPFRMAR